MKRFIKGKWILYFAIMLVFVLTSILGITNKKVEAGTNLKGLNLTWEGVEPLEGESTELDVNNLLGLEHCKFNSYYWYIDNASYADARNVKTFSIGHDYTLFIYVGLEDGYSYDSNTVNSDYMLNGLIASSVRMNKEYLLLRFDYKLYTPLTDISEYGIYVDSTLITTSVASGEGWSFIFDSVTDRALLNLNGFNGKYIESGKLLYITLNGKNTITMDPNQDNGIFAKNSIVINGSSDAELNISQPTSLSSYGFAMRLNNIDNHLIAIKGGKVNIDVKEAYGALCGFTIVDNNASLLVNSEKGYGVYRLIANTTGNISIIAREKPVNYYFRAIGTGEVHIETTKDNGWAIQGSFIVGTEAGIVSVKGQVIANSGVDVDIAPNKKIEGLDGFIECYFNNENRDRYLSDINGNVLESFSIVNDENTAFRIYDSAVFDIPSLKLNDYYYGQTLECAVRGGKAPYVFSIKEGSLPEGISFTKESGFFSISATKITPAGSCTLLVEDNGGKDGCETCEIVINYGEISDRDRFITVDGTKENVKNNSSGTNWSYSANEKTLILTGYNGRKIHSEDDLKVIINNNNEINLDPNDEYGIYVEGTLTIESGTNRKTDNLLVKQSGANNSNYYGIYAKSTIINSGNVEVYANSCYMAISSDVNVNNDANLSVIRDITSFSKYFAVNKLIANTTGTITITDKYIPIRVLVARGSGEVIIKCTDENSQATWDGIFVEKTAGNVTFEGSVYSHNSISDIVIAPNKKIEGVDNFITGYYKKDLGNYWLTDGNGNVLDSVKIVNDSNDKLRFVESDSYKITTLRYNENSILYLPFNLSSAVRGGDGNYVFAIKEGYKLPLGIYLDGKYGRITGAPTEYLSEGEIVVVVKDNNGEEGCQECEITIPYNAVAVDKPVSGVTLNSELITLGSVDDTYNLIASVIPNDASITDVSWYSDNDKVATVSKDGLVVAKGYGKAVITVKTKQGNKSALCVVYVKEESPIISIKNNAFIGLVPNAKYEVTNDLITSEIVSDKNGVINILEEWLEKEISIVKANEEAQACSEPVKTKVVKVTYDKNGGSGSDYFEYVQVGKLSLSDSYYAAPDYMKFDGWSLSQNGELITSINIEENTTLYAIWSIHEHLFTNEIVDVKYLKQTATCTEKSKYYLSCSCGEASKETFEVGEPLGHDIIKGDKVEPTCLESGHEGDLNCSRCDYEEKGKDIPALGHDIIKGDKVEPTYLESGHEGDLHCSRCDYEEKGKDIPALGHDIIKGDKVEPTCLESGHEGDLHCSRCDYEEKGKDIPALGHNFGDDNVCDICNYTDENTKKDNNISTGGVIAIVIGSSVILGAGGFSLYFFVYKKKKLIDFINIFKKK